MKSIDLYSGIGGWTLGMKLSGVQHIQSYEWLKVSNLTHNHNFNTNTTEIDIREMSFSEVPKTGTIDFVVGSPPCTQFSYSNKGGKGNIEDGLIDIYRFLEVVEYLKPKYWVMENVPRVKKILDIILNEDKRFRRFKKLLNFNEVVNFSEYGVPQKRRRTICGNFPYKLFLEYKKHCKIRTLGDVVQSLKSDEIVDPIYGYNYPNGEISDHIIEKPLNWEELRLNRESKTYHPVYNLMSFPEKMDFPSRTITSTCTRVSRESLIVKDGEGFRRLTIRERGCLQGFPITFNFYGKSYTSKQQMIGNSIPPVVTYYLFQSMLETPPDELVPIESVSNYYHPIPKEQIPITPPDEGKGKYRTDRSFKMSIQGLRFGSGVRFELSNEKIDSGMKWSMKFFYGSSKNIIRMDFQSSIVQKFIKKYSTDQVSSILNEFSMFCGEVSSKSLQDSWIHVSRDGIHPYHVLDTIEHYVESIIPILNLSDLDDNTYKEMFVLGMNKKLYHLKEHIITGILIGNVFNKGV